jgi:predicted sulfurtransferase
MNQLNIDCINSNNVGAPLENKNAAKGKIWSDAIRKAVNEVIEDEEGKPRKLVKLARKIVDKGLEGDITAIKEIGDRLEGKVLTQLSISSTTLVIDASLLSEAGKLLEIIAGHTEPEALEHEVEQE